MIDKTSLKQILASNQKDVESYTIIPRQLPSDEFQRRVFMGVRRAGKSYMLYQKIQQELSQGKGWESMLYLNFEDDRLSEFTMQDFDLILGCHAEMYDERPMLFLDEVQNIEGWEKFARRLADAKYSVWITGSNAKMLSSEIMTTLGGRYLTTEVYPFSFTEYLNAQNIAFDQISQLATESKARIIRTWNEYMQWGGLPESIGLTIKRDYISSTFQKIYLGDITSRNKISNQNTLRILIKKLAENIGQPISYNRLAHILSSVSGKITMPTISKYIEYSESAWLLLRLRNLSATFAEKETSCKYYFIDNGVLNLFIMNGETSLLENSVALSLFQHYGHDNDNERVFFYNEKFDIDFYIPDDKLAIQVSYTISKSDFTFKREVEALTKFAKINSCNQRLIITNNEEQVINDNFGVIHVIPAWKWFLSLS